MNGIIKKKKKIIFLITGSGVGGAEIVVKNLIFNIDQDKFNPIFVSIRPLGIIGEEIGKNFKTFSLMADKKFNPLFLLRLFSIIRKEEPDILHCHLFHANFLGRIIGKILGVPFIISTVHSDNFGGTFRYFLLKITDFLNDFTVVVSKKIEEDLIKRKIVPISKIKIIYNGVEDGGDFINKLDIDTLKKELKINNKYPIILSVGRLMPVKGHIYLIRAISLLIKKYPDLRLLLIGDGSERMNLEAESTKLGLNNNILFLGEIIKTEPYYRLADIFVLPSINEGFGLAIVEAISNKLLVVASNVGGIPEIIKNNINGFIVNPEDYIMLSKKIDHILEMNNHEKEKIIDTAYNDFKNNFSLKRMLNQYNSLYN